MGMERPVGAVGIGIGAGGMESKAMPKKESNEKGSRIGDRRSVGLDLRSSALSQMTLLVTRRNDPTFPTLGPYSHENTGRLSK